MLANAVYAAAYTLEINSPSLETAVFRLKIEYMGNAFVPVFWFLFARAFVNETRRMSLRRLVSLSLVPIVTVALMWTNERHGLIYRSLRIADPEGPLSILTSDGARGLWYWVNTSYLYVLLFVGTVSIIAQLSRSSGKFRGQMVTTSVAILLPWIGHLVLIMDLAPLGLDTTPFLTTISGALLAYGIGRYSLLDLAPIAREAVLDAIEDGVIVIDLKGRFVDANKAAKAAFSVVAEAEEGSEIRDLLEPLGIGPGGGPREFTTGSGGAVRHYSIASVEIRAGGGEPRGTAVIVHETTETVELLARLERLVATDELTQVYNRRHFFELAELELDRARRSGAPLSFAMLDLDNFKRVNDERGHAAGDAALVSVCSACRAVLRSTDMLCRYGGEEFVVILPDAAPETALETMERVRRSIETTTIGFGNGDFSVTASIGVAGSAGPPYLELEEYLKRSDSALYRAKAEGRNRVSPYRGHEPSRPRGGGRPT